MSETSDWQPTAGFEVIQQRARMLEQLRAFFSERNVLEVGTPMLSRAATTDVHIDSFQVADPDLGWQGYLHTSPEFPMKRLLAAGSGSIYQVCKVFRRAEQGARHNPEFSMLEWYRVGFDHHQLMQEVDEFVRSLLSEYIKLAETQSFSYQSVFQQRLAINPFTATVTELKDCAEKHGCPDVIGLGLEESEKDNWLELLLSHAIEPSLPKNCPVFIYDFPASQASLARIRNDEFPVAERFELYIHGMELANGFHELADGKEQRQRFENDNHLRQQQGKQQLVMDENLLAALEQGLPDCAGVALGLDRLLMLATGSTKIEQVLSFSFDSA